MPAVTDSTLGAWLLKASPEGLPVDEVVASSFRTVTSRCVRPSYRVELVRAGQPVLLWLSGRHPRHPAGIYASGHATGPVQEPAEPGAEPWIPVRLQAVEPVLRTDVLADPVLRELEVVRMPAGSNPSYLDRSQWRTLRQAFPQVDIGWTP